MFAPLRQRARLVDCIKRLKIFHRALERVGAGAFNPLEITVFSRQSRGQHDGLGQFTALNFGHIKCIALGVVHFTPQTDTTASLRSTRATRALIGGGATDALGTKCVNAALGVVTMNARVARVHHGANTWHRD